MKRKLICDFSYHKENYLVLTSSSDKLEQSLVLFYRVFIQPIEIAMRSLLDDTNGLIN